MLYRMLKLPVMVDVAQGSRLRAWLRAEMQESDKKPMEKGTQSSIPINRGLIQAIMTSLPPQPIGEFKYEYSSPVHEALSLVRADLLSPPKRIRDSDSMTDFEVEEGYVRVVPRETDNDECFVYAECYRARRWMIECGLRPAADEESREDVPDHAPI
ncbi:hypothetical protein Tco_0576281 [Tanacetum coccineum]